ncbi:DUF5590 domain-containing protein [Bacillus sp. FJAT-29790]|uniref:cell wall elongation regulator TseB-like domain-containing protein n=1 Tax=Bacillus sp. FJAT-29790 TaxID=1895002 RepID=UPI001C239CDF|nr:DUF5590 domain-containing protein [Bacillus sp. FJAT-29790]
MKKFIIISIIIFVVILGTCTIIYVNAQKPVKAAEKKAIQIAMQETKLREAEDFYLYHGHETYYVLKGKDGGGTGIYVWIPEKDGRIIVRKQSDGVTKQEAIDKLREEKNPKKIISVRLGMEKNIPLWEIYYRSEGDLINYYYVDFKTGEWLKKIENL